MSLPNPVPPAQSPVLPVLLALSLCHLANDLLQSLLPAIYPLLKARHGLDFADIGLIALTYQVTASLLQPFVGLSGDRHPRPAALPWSALFTLAGLLVLASAAGLAALLAGAALVGIGSSIFHPEASRVARLAAGARHGLAQSLFQAGGNLGAAAGPLLAAAVVLPRGQAHIAWFGALALPAALLLSWVAGWSRRAAGPGHAAAGVLPRTRLPAGRVIGALCVLLVLMFSKFVYMACLGNYYTFFLVARFGLTPAQAQPHLVLFLVAVAAGTFAGGPLGDRLGRRRVIRLSILGVLPFSVLLPHAGLAGTDILAVLAGLLMTCAFSSLLVYAQELLPGRVGTVSGLFFGLAFGLGGLGAAALGLLADHIGIEAVFALCGWLPALGVFTIALPDVGREAAPAPGLAAAGAR